jgi:hypothetical protein
VRLRVLRVAAEIEDVALRQAQVLEQPPGRVRQSVGLPAAQLGRKPVHGLVEPGVRVVPREGAGELRAQRRHRVRRLNDA